MENNKVKKILTMTGLGVMVASSITACGKNKEMQPTKLDQIKEQNAVDALAEQKSTEAVSDNSIEEEMTSITLEKELKEHEKEFTDAGYTLETEGLVNKYSKLRRFGNNIEVSIEKTIEYLDDLASADEALNKLGKDTSEADKAAEVKEQVQTEQKTAEQTKDVYEGSKSNTTTTQNTAPATPAPADTSSSTASDLEKQSSSTQTGDPSIQNLQPGDTLGDGSTVTITGNDEEINKQLEEANPDVLDW